MWSGRGPLCFGRLNIGNENTSVDMALLSWEHRIAISKANALLVLSPGSELEALCQSLVSGHTPENDHWPGRLGFQPPGPPPGDTALPLLCPICVQGS